MTRRTNTLRKVRQAFLHALGFPNRWINKVARKTPSLYPVENAKANIDYFTLVGVADPIRLCTRFPALLGYNLQRTIKPKLKALRHRGFRDPLHLLTRFPAVLGYDLDTNVEGKLLALEQLGFDNPIRLIERCPSIIGLRLDRNIKTKIKGLRELGFRDPIRLITTSPIILTLHLENNVARKIQALRALGFQDPITMITRSPALLNLERNIRPKVAALAKHFGRRKLACAYLEENPSGLIRKTLSERTLRRFAEAIDC